MDEKTQTVGLTYFKRNLERVTRSMNQSGREIVVMRRNAPWVKVVPLATESGRDSESIKQ